MKKIRIAVAEDHLSTMLAIQTLLSACQDIEVVLKAVNGKDLIKQLESTPADIILMDLSMPLMNGIAATKIVRTKYPQIKIIANTFFDQEKNIIEMNRLGVKSFVSKGDGTELMRAIETVSQGGVYFPDEIAKVIQQNLKNDEPSQSIDLSGTEKFVLRAVVDGLTSKEIAKGINKSHRTVDDYRESLFKKFQVDNKEQLIAKAVRLGIA
jgi:DNA-binding NarL/FixJ family response regulator